MSSISISELARDRYFPSEIRYAGGAAKLELVKVAHKSLSKPFLIHEYSKTAEAKTVLLNELVIDTATSEPLGFIFQTGRCGSSLIVRMFHQEPSCQVISECLPLGNIWGLELREEKETVAKYFRKLVSLLCAIGDRQGQRTLLKFQSAILFRGHDVINNYPHIPRALMVRDPLEILVALTRNPPVWLQRKIWQKRFAQDPDHTGKLIADFLHTICKYRVNFRHHGRFYDFLGQVLKALLEDAIAIAPGSRILDYSNISLDSVKDMANWFDIEVSPTSGRLMEEMMAYDAKRDIKRPFVPDTERKRRDATPLIREFCEHHLDPLYQELLAR